MDVQIQELTKNCKDKEAFGKASESDSTLTKMIKENYLLKRENKKLQERIAVPDNVTDEILMQQDNAKDNKNQWEKPKKTKTGHYNNKHPRQSTILRQRTLLIYSLMKHHTILSQKMR